MDFEDLLPQTPDKGPPLPSRLGLHWPWLSNPGNPLGDPAIYDTAPDAEIEEMTQKKREEFRAKGYPPGLTEKALLWAKDWAWGLPGVKAAYDVSPEVGRQVYKGIYSRSLALSDRWIESLSQS